MYRNIAFAAAVLLFLLAGCAHQPVKVGNYTTDLFNNSFDSSFNVPKVSSEYYPNALKSLKRGRLDSLPNVDLVRFRYSYLLFKDSTAIYIPQSLTKDFATAISEGDAKTAGRLADKMLALDFTDMDAHTAKALSLKSDDPLAIFHKTMAEKLLASILGTGDGKTPESAFHISQIKEALTILNAVGLRLKQQGLANTGTRPIDVMNCLDSENKPTIIYFDTAERR